MGRERDTILDRIQKLQTLADEAGGGTEAERGVALERAKALMDKYNIEQADLLERKGASAMAGVEEWEAGNWAQRDQWKVKLVKAICGENGVVAIAGGITIGSQGKLVSANRVLVIAPLEVIEFTRVLFKWLEPQLERECDAKLDEAMERVQGSDGWLLATPGAKSGVTMRYRESFLDAASAAVAMRLRGREADDTEAGMAMVVAVKKKAAEHLGVEDLSETEMPFVGGIGTEAGIDAGSRADIDPGSKVEGANRRELGV